MDGLAVPGGLVDDRYRLQEIRSTRGDATLWRGVDDVLDRPVAVRVVRRLTKPDAEQLVAAAGRAGGVPDARWVRVLDTGRVAEQRRWTVWVVTEWVDAPSLAAIVRSEPLDPAVAVGVVAGCAQAVAAAAGAGLTHGRLHPGEVLLPADGQPRLTDVGIASPLHEQPPAYDDLRGLGGLLLAAVSGRWPLPGWTGLPRVQPPIKRRPAWSVRSRRRRDAEAVAVAALKGELPDVPSFCRALAALPTAPVHPVDTDPAEPATDPAWRLWAWRLVPPALVAAVAAAAWSAGSDLGNVPGPARTAGPGLTAPKASGPGGGRTLVWSRPPRVTSFDPAGDGAEDPGGVGLAVDGDPSTAWTTDLYRSAALGGLKPGVGLLLDLRHPMHVRSVALQLSAAGAAVSVRAGNVRPAQADDLPTVAGRDSLPVGPRLTLRPAVTARYWLLWFSTLPPAAGGYRLGVDEVSLLR